jgi:pyrimidine operon attenuation protein/uracil phosphoribosyltransferase
MAIMQLAGPEQVAELIDTLAEAIAHDVGPARDGAPWAMVGLRSRGDELARRLAERLKPDHLGTLDITLYRDDLSEIGPQPIVRTTEVDFALDGIDLVLVDDVLMSGRSVRAALQSLMDFGRPRRIWLSVLVDRGGRELPIAADHVAMDLNPETGARTIGPDQLVKVHLTPDDDCDEIIVVD